MVLVCLSDLLRRTVRSTPHEDDVLIRGSDHLFSPGVIFRSDNPQDNFLLADKNGTITNMSKKMFSRACFTAFTDPAACGKERQSEMTNCKTEAVLAWRNGVTLKAIIIRNGYMPQKLGNRGRR